MSKRPLVSVVDDNEAVRESLPDLLQHVGFAVQAFASAEAFLASESRRPDELLDPRRRVTRDERTRSSTRIGTPRACRPNRLHHRPRRQVAASAPPRPWGGRVPVQAIQR